MPSRRRHNEAALARFNEAEARAPRMRIIPLKLSLAIIASMRPRRVRLGCVESAELRKRHALASMRPRRVRLGCTQPITLCSARQSRCVFERAAAAAVNAGAIPAGTRLDHVKQHCNSTHWLISSGSALHLATTLLESRRRNAPAESYRPPLAPIILYDGGLALDF